MEVEDIDNETIDEHFDDTVVGGVPSELHDDCLYEFNGTESGDVDGSSPCRVHVADTGIPLDDDSVAEAVIEHYQSQTIVEQYQTEPETVIIYHSQTPESAAETAQAVESISQIEVEGTSEVSRSPPPLETVQIVKYPHNGSVPHVGQVDVLGSTHITNLTNVGPVSFAGLNLATTQGGFVNISGSTALHSSFDNTNVLLPQEDVEEFFDKMERPMATSVSLSGASYTTTGNGHLTTLTNAPMTSQTTYQGLLGASGGIVTLPQPSVYSGVSHGPHAPYHSSLSSLYLPSSRAHDYGLSSSSPPSSSTPPSQLSSVWHMQPSQESAYTNIGPIPTAGKYPYSLTTNDNGSPSHILRNDGSPGIQYPRGQHLGEVPYVGYLAHELAGQAGISSFGMGVDDVRSQGEFIYFCPLVQIQI